MDVIEGSRLAIFELSRLMKDDVLKVGSMYPVALRGPRSVSTMLAAALFLSLASLDEVLGRPSGTALKEFQDAFTKLCLIDRTLKQAEPEGQPEIN